MDKEKQNGNISFLIGAGFSAPMGYPIGNKLNELLLKCTGDDFAFGPHGGLTIRTDGAKPDFGYKTSYDISFDFCKELIQYFNESVQPFDYERFYDFLHEGARKDNNVESLASKYTSETWDKNQLIYSLDNIYVQLVAFYLKDRNGKKWYDDEAFILGTYLPGYSGFLSCLKEILKNNIVNVHTLNHDLFFERLNYTEAINGELCDGYEELGSPYYGNLHSEGRVFKVRLERYTGIYKNKCRLFKLHGSRDYGVYYSFTGSVASPENYLKTRYGVGFSDLFKEIKKEDGSLDYEHCWINYHADFLTGTTSKIQRYKEPLLYNKLFDIFEANLKTSDKLIIIGYGAKDDEINNYLLNYFEFNNKSSIIIDPYPSDAVKELAKKLNSKLITTQLENLSLAELE